MPQETIHIMTTYEMIATAIAILALLQPWIIKLWDRFSENSCQFYSHRENKALLQSKRCLCLFGWCY